MAKHIKPSRFFSEMFHNICDDTVYISWDNFLNTGDITYYSGDGGAPIEKKFNRKTLFELHAESIIDAMAMVTVGVSEPKHLKV